MKEKAKSDMPSPTAGDKLDRLEIYSLTARGLMLGIALLLAFWVIAGLLG